MSEVRQHELQEKTQQLLQGPLKHVRAAALAAALLPLASVAATPAAAQSCAPASGGFCGVVFNDANNNGTYDAGETGIEGVRIVVTDTTNPVNTFETETGPGGGYSLELEGGTYTIGAFIPTGAQPSTANIGSDLFDSDADHIVNGFSVTDITIDYSGGAVDFGFYTAPVAQPGTGTPGFWKNHPEAWPLPGITIGGIYYPKATAISWLGKVGKDKTTTIFASLVSAKLNQKMGNEDSCIAGTVTKADGWLAAHPVGSNVLASSAAWAQAEPWHQLLDAYNNGLLCAPPRQ